MSAKAAGRKIIVFSCNWQAYSSLENAGVSRSGYSADVYPIRLACLGRITPGIILKAFEKGAAGVYLIGCAEGECQHQTGSRTARQVYQQTRNLLEMLGYRADQLRFSLLEAGDGEGFVRDLEGLLAAGELPQG